jgi:hypothetical protein
MKFMFFTEGNVINRINTAGFISPSSRADSDDPVEINLAFMPV